MWKRLVMGALLSVVLVGLTGCPATQVSPGTWVFFLTSDGTFFTASRALDVMGDGSTQDPDPIPPNTSLFLGALTWMQNGSTFTMSQVADSATTTYMGTVNSSTSMDGTWSAEKL